MQPLPRFGRDSAPWSQAQVPGQRGRDPPFSATSVASHQRPCHTFTRPTTLFSPASSGGVLGLHEPPGHQPRSRRFSPDGGDFPRDDSRFPVLARPFGTHAGHRDDLRASSPAACSGLQATLLTPCLRSGTPTITGILGFSSHFERWLSALASTRCRVGPVTELIAVTQWPPQSAGYL
jgi:hypothetical protein